MTAADRLRAIAGDAADRTVTGQPVSGRTLHDIALWAADAHQELDGIRSYGQERGWLSQEYDRHLTDLLADLDRIVGQP